MITREQIPQVVGHPVFDAKGRKIGAAKHMYIDDATGEPAWVTVRTGLFGGHETFVPTDAARIVEGHLEVPYVKDTVKGAPSVALDEAGHLSADQERRLYGYYGLQGPEGLETPPADSEGIGAGGTAGRAAGPPDDTGLDRPTTPAAPAGRTQGQGPGTQTRPSTGVGMRPGGTPPGGMSGSEAGAGTGTGPAPGTGAGTSTGTGTGTPTGPAPGTGDRSADEPMDWSGTCAPGDRPAGGTRRAPDTSRGSAWAEAEMGPGTGKRSSETVGDGATFAVGTDGDTERVAPDERGPAGDRRTRPEGTEEKPGDPPQDRPQDRP